MYIHTHMYTQINILLVTGVLFIRFIHRVKYSLYCVVYQYIAWYILSTVACQAINLVHIQVHFCSASFVLSLQLGQM